MVSISRSTRFRLGGAGRSWHWFIFHITGGQYRVAMFSASVLPQVRAFLVILHQQFAFFGLVPLFIGLVRCTGAAGKFSCFYCYWWRAVPPMPSPTPSRISSTTSCWPTRHSCCSPRQHLRVNPMETAASVRLVVTAAARAVAHYPLCSQRGDYRGQTIPAVW